jgi:hypothetical protein
VIGTTFSAGEVVGADPDTSSDATGWNVRDVVRRLGPADPDSIDGLLASARDTPGALDLRTLTPADAALIGGSRPMRSLDQYIDVPVTAAYDALVHVPEVTLWHSPAMPVLLQ